MEYDSRAVDVHNLGHCPACRCILNALGLYCFPCVLGCCKRMVSVAHCKERIILGLKCQELVGYSLHGRVGGRDEPAPQVAAFLHKCEVVYLLEAVPVFVQVFDKMLILVVDEHKDMRHIKGCVLSDLYPHRKPLYNCLLGRLDKACGSLAVIVLVQVQVHQQSDTCRAIVGLPLNQHESCRQLLEHSCCQVFVHSLVDLWNLLVQVHLLKVNLRQEQVQCGGASSYKILCLLPICVVGCELVSGNYCPFLKCCLGLIWNIYLRNSYSCIFQCAQGVSPFKKSYLFSHKSA